MTPEQIQQHLAVDKLKPCPFCGGEASCDSLGEYHDDEQNEREDFCVACKSCNAVFPPTSSRSESVDKWNNRASDSIIKHLLTVIEKQHGALELVLDVVGGCHDCWDLSANENEKQRVEQALALSAPLVKGEK